jgi:hypothetical protein
VTDFAKFLGWSTLHLITAMWYDNSCKGMAVNGDKASEVNFYNKTANLVPAYLSFSNHSDNSSTSISEYYLQSYHNALFRSTTTTGICFVYQSNWPCHSADKFLCMNIDLFNFKVLFKSYWNYTLFLGTNNLCILKVKRYFCFSIRFQSFFNSLESTRVLVNTCENPNETVSFGFSQT